MSRLPTPSSRLPTPARSRLLPAARTASSAATKRTLAGPAPDAAGAKRSKLDVSNSSTSSIAWSSSLRSSAPTSRHLLRSSSAPHGVGLKTAPKGSSGSAGSMRPPSSRGLLRSQSVVSLNAPAGRPPRTAAGARGGPMRDVTSSVTSRQNKAAAAADGPPRPGGGRQPWDLKGRLQDMEAVLSKKGAQHDEVMQLLLQTQERVARMEAEKQQLEAGVQQKEAATEQIQGEVQRVRAQLLERGHEAEEERRRLTAQLSDLQSQLAAAEAAGLRQQTQLMELQTQLRAKTEEAAALTTSLGQLTASQAVVQAQLTAAQLTVVELTAARDQLTAALAARDRSVAELEAKSRAEETLRRQLHNQVQELRGNIRVFCRLRPLLPEEAPLAGGQIPHLHCTDQHTIDVGKLDGDERRQTMTGRKKEEADAKVTFTFDRVFPPTTPQAELFEEVSQLIQSALDGYNVCVFAYGQTGSGKTHTMEGGLDPETEGMIPRALRQIFQSCSALTQKGWKYSLEASFLEIYNETIKDLLNTAKTKEAHEIRMVESKPGGPKGKEVYVTNLKVVPVLTEEDVSSLLRLARQQRAVAATNCNEMSSRSHSVFTLRLTGDNRLTSETSHGTLNLVDLAGSERLKESGSQGDRLTETKNINKSLANLGNVIMALAAKQEHVPYRNSKLTHLLQHSLGGNSKTLMLVNISPREDFTAETLNSLRFAAKVNQCHIGTASRRNK